MSNYQDILLKFLISTPYQISWQIYPKKIFWQNNQPERPTSMTYENDQNLLGNWNAGKASQSSPSVLSKKSVITIYQDDLLNYLPAQPTRTTCKRSLPDRYNPAPQVTFEMVLIWPIVHLTILWYLKIENTKLVK